ncbi:MAG: hypothetical protein ACR2GN_00925 [Bacteroidia bacterium]
MAEKGVGVVPYIVRLLIFTCIILLIAYAIEPAIPEQFQSGWFYPLIYFFALTAFLLHYFLYKVSKGNPRRFISYFMGATGIKLFLYMTVLLIFVFSLPERAVGFISEFFVLYVLYTIFEVYFTLKLKHRQP